MTGSSQTKPSAHPRIVHVTTVHPANDVRIFERECRSLVASGRYDVYLAAAGAIPPDSGVSFIPFAPAPVPRPARFWSSLRKAFSLSAALSADLWHFHDPELLPVALRMARSGRSVIWDAHEDYVEQFTRDGAKNWVPTPGLAAARIGTRRLLEMVDRRVAGVVCATPTIASRYANPRTVVVGNEARLELFEDCTPAFDAKQVLFTGSPGPAHLFEQVVTAVSQVPGVRLAVAGRDPEPGMWARCRSVLGDRLVHLGWLDRTGIAAAINASSIGLSTYADVRTNADNSPNKLFEFGAAGLPVVASPTASNRRFLTSSNGGGIALDFSAPALARAISDLLSDQTAWESASRAGRAWAARVGSWTASEERLLGLYAEILGVGEGEERRHSQ